jgi:diguanylate cyclase (GGDEF)-like protein
MGNVKARPEFFKGIIYVSAIIMTIHSLWDRNYWFVDIKIYIIFLFGSILLGLFAINSGKALIDLTDSVIAFIYISFGRKEAILFVIIYWLGIGLIDKKFKRSHNKGIFFNLCIMVVETYLTATILLHTMNYLTNNTLIRTIFFVGLFLLINISLYKFEIKFVEGIKHKLGRETRLLLCLNFVASSILSVLFSILGRNSNYSGCIIGLLAIAFLYHFYYIYRKLRFRSDCMKKLIKITSDMVKHGDFNEKCNILLSNLKELIPYEVCAIYTLDSENDSLLYPISYIAPEGLKIGDLDVNRSGNGITAKVISEGKIYISKDLKRDKRIKASGKLLDITETAIIVPITIDTSCAGFITICGGRDLALFIDNGVEDILSLLSNQMALAIENDSIYRSMRDEADYDFLTNLYNRRAFEGRISKLIASNTRFSLVIYDIDDFKNVNDSYGHLMGDEALKVVCGIIKRSIRKTDFAFRYGGEELVILFNNLSKEDALTISDRIREKIKTTPIIFNDININITISGGISCFPEDGITREEIIGYADGLLYNECKSKGKDRVCAYKSVEEL